MRIKTPPDLLWSGTVIAFVGIGMLIGYAFSAYVISNSLLSHINVDRKLYFLIADLYLLVVWLGLNFAIECLYIEREIYFKRVFASKVLVKITLSYAIGFTLLDIFLNDMLIITIINIFLGYILCKLSSITEIVKGA